jgi:hypothetical protein
MGTSSEASRRRRGPCVAAARKPITSWSQAAAHTDPRRCRPPGFTGYDLSFRHYADSLLADDVDVCTAFCAFFRWANPISLDLYA